MGYQLIWCQNHFIFFWMGTFKKRCICINPKVMCPMAMNIWFTSYRKHYMVLRKFQGPKTKRLKASWKNRNCKKLNESQPILPKWRHENHNYFFVVHWGLPTNWRLYQENFLNQRTTWKIIWTIQSQTIELVPQTFLAHTNLHELIKLCGGYVEKIWAKSMQ